jgi:A/G-specific adenine glycosylase
MTKVVDEGLMRSARAMSPVLAPQLVAWQRSEGRHHLPWQNTRDPYRVWLSEIMLQQTQVGTVLGYYDRFLLAFPDVAGLAAAQLDEVLTLWAGLGYYSRARNLHACAQAVVALHGGQFPQTAEVLETLPGIGRSTAAAIASFCFAQRTPILDGNVKRVLTRVLGWGEDLAISRHEKALWQAADALLPLESPDMPAYTQGLMDLGATVCTQRKPSCLVCPWQSTCVALQQGQCEAYPVRTRKLKRSSRESWCLWLEHEGAVWLVQRPAKGIWASLWTLPMFESEETMLSVAPGPLEIQPTVNHVLTHLDWRLHLRRTNIGERLESTHLGAWPIDATQGSGRWVAFAELSGVGLPTPFRRWLKGG